MKALTTTIALAATVLAIGVPLASAAAQPDALDRYLEANPPASVPDAIDRYRWNNSAPSRPVPDAIDRYLWNNEGPSATGAADHPDSLAVRPTVVGEPVSLADDGRDWGTGALGAFVGLLVALLVGSTTVLRDHRRLAH
jgi:hypothetical protein